MIFVMCSISKLESRVFYKYKRLKNKLLKIISKVLERLKGREVEVVLSLYFIKKYYL